MTCSDRDALMEAMDRLVKHDKWIGRAKRALKERGLNRARVKCPECGEKGIFAIAGSRDHARFACPTANCLRFME